jgi:hypothetical protein
MPCVELRHINLFAWDRHSHFLHPTWVTVRVARLGESWPLGRLLPLGSFLKITEVAQIFVLLFSTVKVMY